MQHPPTHASFANKARTRSSAIVEATSYPYARAVTRATPRLLEFPLGFAGHAIGHGAGIARNQGLTEVLHLLSKYSAPIFVMLHAHLLVPSADEPVPIVFPCAENSAPRAAKRLERSSGGESAASHDSEKHGCLLQWRASPKEAVADRQGCERLGCTEHHHQRHVHRAQARVERDEAGREGSSKNGRVNQLLS